MKPYRIESLGLLFLILGTVLLGSFVVSGCDDSLRLGSESSLVDYSDDSDEEDDIWAEEKMTPSLPGGDITNPQTVRNYCAMGNAHRCESIWGDVNGQKFEAITVLSSQHGNHTYFYREYTICKPETCERPVTQNCDGYQPITWEGRAVLGLPKKPNPNKRKPRKPRPKKQDKTAEIPPGPKPKPTPIPKTPEDPIPKIPQGDPMGEKLPRTPEATDPNDGFKGETSSVPGVDPYGREERISEEYKSREEAVSAIEERKRLNREYLDETNKQYADSKFKTKVYNDLLADLKEYNQHIDNISKIVKPVPPIKNPDDIPDIEPDPGPDADLPPGPDRENLKSARQHLGYAKGYLDTYEKPDKETKEQLTGLSELGIDFAKFSFKIGDSSAGNATLSNVHLVLDFVTDVVPGVSGVKDAIIVSTGINPVTLEAVDAPTRAILAGSFFVPAVASGSAKGLVKFLKAAKNSPLGKKILNSINSAAEVLKKSVKDCFSPCKAGEILDNISRRIEYYKLTKPSNVSAYANTKKHAKVLDPDKNGLPNFEKQGGFEQAVKDWEQFEFQKIFKNEPDLKAGQVNDSTRVIARRKSSEGWPTIEVQKLNSRNKFRAREKTRYK